MGRAEVNAWVINTLKDRLGNWELDTMRRIVQRMDRCRPGIWEERKGQKAELQEEYMRCIELACEFLMAHPNPLHTFQLGVRVGREGMISMTDTEYAVMIRLIEKLLAPK
ncbi:hypothetical protein EXS71_01985 [Candidatus Uhrbacteria bacterium]|nr:hypothetical protein [Candidatus Uhrbacteria bacterium]